MVEEIFYDNLPRKLERKLHRTLGPSACHALKCSTDVDDQIIVKYLLNH